jgi:hypothetical protein
MAGYDADGELAGGEAGRRHGAQAPPPVAGPADEPGESSADGLAGNVPVGDDGYALPFVTEYTEYVEHADPAEEGFGWLLNPDAGEPERELPEPPLPIDDLGDEAAMVRPYAWTRGRTKANYDLKLETLISATELAADETLLPQLEHRAVSSLCRYPLSVAEVAAKLSIPLGVARVILSDMAELGLISIHRTFADDDIAAHLVLMERVLSGLRRL